MNDSASNDNMIEISAKQLPLHCPTASLWDLHPKIYLPIDDKKKTARCPYCGTLYVLKTDI